MNSGDYSKTWLADSLNQLATLKALSAIQQTGRALPCSVVSISGQIVTVKFEVNSAPFTLPQVTIPIATSFYDWVPLQVGDEGMTLPADVYLGGISGLGGGTANMTQRGNLSALMFVPCAKKSWTVPNVNQRVVQGPSGVLIRTTAGTIYIDLTGSGIAIQGNVTITGALTATGNITAGQGGADQIDMQGHTHNVVNVQTGSSTVTTTAPLAGT